MLNFDFFEKSLRLFSPPHFVYDSSRKIFLMIYYFNWSYWIAWLPLFIVILGIMFVFICFAVYDVITLKVTLAFCGGTMQKWCNFDIWTLEFKICGLTCYLIQFKNCDRMFTELCSDSSIDFNSIIVQHIVYL